MPTGESPTDDSWSLHTADMSLNETAKNGFVIPKPFPKSATFYFVIETSNVPTKNIHKWGKKLEV